MEPRKKNTRLVEHIMGNTIITTGTFNLIHPGHIHFLKRAKSLGDRLVVLLDSDERNKELKEEKRLFSFEERREILQSLSFVDCVKQYDGPTKLFKTILALETRDGSNLFFVKGGDYNIGSMDQDQLRILRSMRATVVFLEYKKGYSTTEIFEEIWLRQPCGEKILDIGPEEEYFTHQATEKIKSLISEQIKKQLSVVGILKSDGQFDPEYINLRWPKKEVISEDGSSVHTYHPPEEHKTRFNPAVDYEEYND